MRVIASSILRLLAHTRRRIKVGRTPLVEWPARHRHIHNTTYGIHNRQIFMAPAGFESAIPASKRPQTYALDRAASILLNYPYENTSPLWVLNYSSSPVLINCELMHRKDLRISKRWIWMSINLRHITSDNTVILVCTALGNKQRERG